MKERLGVLDGLRGIAILQVLWFHVWLTGGLSAPVPWLQFIPETGGYGVQLFFFLSGFVIVYPFVRSQFANEPGPAWTHFAWRRFIKIVPSYALSIAIAYAIGFAAFERTHSNVLEELTTHAFFIHTWWPGTGGSINRVLWTLAVEAQFYAIFPLIWWCFRRQPWVTGLGLIALVPAGRAWASHCCAAGVTDVLATNLPSFLDVFAFGMLSAWCFVHFGRYVREGRVQRFMPLVAAAGALMATIALVRIYGGHGAIMVAGVPVLQVRSFLGASFALLAFGALCSPRKWTFVLANPLLQFVAVISYNLYLYNWMIAHELRLWHVPPYHGNAAANPHWQALYTLTACTLSIAFAALVTYGLERPLLRLPDPGRALPCHEDPRRTRSSRL